MFTKDQIIEVKIDDLANGGKAIARYDNFVVFVDNAVPGDVAEVKIFKTKKNYAEGKAIRIINPSNLRIAPKCKYFGICGGCKWQNLNYNSQIEFKRKNIIDDLKRIGNLEDPKVNEVIPSEDQFYFRNKMEFSFSNKRWLLEEEKNIVNNNDTFALGLHIPERFDKVLDITECFLQSEISTNILNFTRDFAIKNDLDAFSTKTHIGYLRNLVIREGKKTNELMVNLVTSEYRESLIQKYSDELIDKFPQITTIVNNITSRKSQVAVGESERIIYGQAFINEKIGKYIFQISANSFFQTNTKGTEKLYSVVRNFVNDCNVIWDLYCGAGTISIFLSDKAKKIYGFEIVEPAIIDAKINAELNKINNCTFLTGDLKDIIRNNSAEKPDVIILDPPRNGAHPKVIEEIINISPKEIIYVSCNPQTQSRDLSILKEHYDIIEIQPVDMFPHTMHIENVVKLRRKE